MKLKDDLNPRPLSQEVEFVGVDLPNCIVLSRDPSPPQGKTQWLLVKMHNMPIVLVDVCGKWTKKLLGQE